MKRYFLILGLLVLMLQPNFKNNMLIAQAQTPDKEQIIKKLIEIGAPSEQHKKLNDLVGSWDVTTTMWMDGLDKPPNTSVSTAEVKWILGGRFLRHETEGEFMGMPVQGIGYNGYDNVAKKFTMFWIDNSSTAMYTADGNFDESGKILSYYGRVDDAISGECGKNVKFVVRFVNKDKWVFEFHDKIYEANSKVGEMVYTRKK